MMVVLGGAHTHHGAVILRLLASKVSHSGTQAEQNNSSGPTSYCAMLILVVCSHSKKAKISWLTIIVGTPGRLVLVLQERAGPAAEGRQRALPSTPRTRAAGRAVAVFLGQSGGVCCTIRRQKPSRASFWL